MTPFRPNSGSRVFRGVRLAAAVGLVLLLTLSARAAGPRDEVLRLVPDDVGLCLIIQDLREHTATLVESPFARQFRTSAFGRRILAAPEVQKLIAVDSVLQQHLRIRWADLRDDILGDIVVLAYRPGPPGKPEQEQGLVVLRARNEKRLTDVVARLNQVQLASGDLKKLDELRYEGRTYYRRVEKKGENYYYVNGPTLVFSTREAMLRQVLALEGKSLAEEPRITGELRRLGVHRELAALWVNPRAYESELGAKAARAQGGEAVFLKALLTYWKALDGVALSAAIRNQDVELNLAVSLKQDRVLPGGRRLLAGVPRVSELWTRFPDRPLVAVAGQVDAAGLTEFLGDFVSDDARQAIRASVDRGVGAALGQDVGRDVLPALGPDWGFCVLAPPPEEKGWFPHVIWVLRVRPGNGKPPLDQALLSALNSLAMLAVFGFNNEHPDTPTRLERLQQGGNELHYLVNEKLFPPGLQPAFALIDGYLILASSPEAIRRFGPAGNPPAAGNAVPLLRLSLRGWRDYLKERKEPLAAYMAQDKHISRDEAVCRLDNLIDGLELFDRLEVSQRVARPGQLLLTVRLRTAAPMANPH